jgi:hypothetical protein
VDIENSIGGITLREKFLIRAISRYRPSVCYLIQKDLRVECWCVGYQTILLLRTAARTQADEVDPHL